MATNDEMGWFPPFTLRLCRWDGARCLHYSCRSEIVVDRCRALARKRRKGQVRPGKETVIGLGDRGRTGSSAAGREGVS